MAAAAGGAGGAAEAALSDELAEARAELEAERAAGALQEARLAQLAAQLVGGAGGRGRAGGGACAAGPNCPAPTSSHRRPRHAPALLPPRQREAAIEKLQLTEAMEALRSQLVAARVAALEANSTAAAAAARLQRVTMAAAAVLPVPLPPVRTSGVARRGSSAAGGVPGCESSSYATRHRRSGSLGGAAKPPSGRRAGAPAVLARQRSAPGECMVALGAVELAMEPGAVERAVAELESKVARKSKVACAEAQEQEQQGGDWRIGTCLEVLAAEEPAAADAAAAAFETPASSEGATAEAAGEAPAATTHTGPAGAEACFKSPRRPSPRRQQGAQQEGAAAAAAGSEKQHGGEDAFSYAAILKRPPANAPPPRAAARSAAGRRPPAAGPRAGKSAGGAPAARASVAAAKGTPFLKPQFAGREAAAAAAAVAAAAMAGSCGSSAAPSARASDAASLPAPAAPASLSGCSGSTGAAEEPRGIDSAPSARSSDSDAAAAATAVTAHEAEDGWQECSGRRRSQRRLRRQQRRQQQLALGWEAGAFATALQGAASEGAAAATAEGGQLCISPAAVRGAGGAHAPSPRRAPGCHGVLHRGGEAAAWYESVCRMTASGAVVCALEDSEGAGAGWGARRERLLLRHGQERLARLLAQAEEAKAQLEATAGSVLAAGAGTYGPAAVAAAAPGVAAAAGLGEGGAGGGAVAGQAFLAWALQVASQQAELGAMIEVRGCCGGAGGKCLGLVHAPGCGRPGVRSPHPRPRRTPAQAERAERRSLKQQLDAALAAAEAPCDGASAAVTDEAETARLERRASDLRARLDARSARLQALLAQQGQLEALRFDVWGAAEAGGAAPQDATLAEALWSQALSLGLAPHEAFGGLLGAAAGLRSRAAELRARAAEAEAEAALQRQLAGLATDEAGDLKQQLEATQVGRRAWALRP
jgi:hypothetical protein